MSLLASPFRGLDGPSLATCPRCNITLPRNVSISAHEATCPRSLALPQDGRTTRLRASNDNSAHSASGTGTGPPSASSPSSHDDMMSDVASATASATSPANHHSPGPSIAVSEGSTTSSGGRRYHLEIIQHPERTAEIGTAAVLSRLPLSPPLVVRITVEDSDGRIIPAHAEMPFMIAYLHLYNQDGTEPIGIDEAHHPGASSGPQEMLYGTLVSSHHTLKDMDGRPGVFFIFPDVSVRRRGTYTLRVSLLRLTILPDGTTVMPVGMANTALASAITDPFNVMPQSEYSAPPATPLTSWFHRQGARMY